MGPDVVWALRGGGGGGAEFFEAPKKSFDQLAPKAPEKIFYQPKARRKIWPNIVCLGGVSGGGGDPPPPSGAEL